MKKERTRTQNSVINIIFGFASKILMSILEFVVRVYFIKYLGDELLGINGLFTNVLLVLSLAEMGMSNVVMFSFYQPLQDKDQTKLAALIQFYKKIYNYIALAVLAVGLGIIPFLGVIVNVKTQVDHVLWIYLIFLADTVFSYLFVFKVTILRSDQKGYIASRYQMVLGLIRTILQIISLIIFKDFVIFLLIRVIGTLLTNFLLARKVDHDYAYINQKADLPKSEQRKIFTIIKSGFVYKLSTVLLNGTDNIIISMMFGTIWVGYLANYITIATAIASFVIILFNSITASVGNLVITEAKEKSLEVFNVALFVGFWSSTLCAAGMWILCDDFIALWIGPSKIMSGGVVLMKVMMLYLSCTLNPIFSFREALGLYQKTKYAMLAAALINIVLSIILGSFWGVFGVLLASIIAMFVTYIWYEPYVLYRDTFGISCKEYFWKQGRNLVFTVVVAVGIQYLLQDMNVSSFFTWGIKGILVFILVNICCAVASVRKKEFKLVIARFMKR